MPELQKLLSKSIDMQARRVYNVRKCGRMPFLCRFCGNLSKIKKSVDKCRRLRYNELYDVGLNVFILKINT